MKRTVYGDTFRELIIKDDHILVPLTMGQFSMIDINDRDIADCHNWYAQKQRGAIFYAVRLFKENGKRHYINLHRAIMKPSSGMVVDHINKNTLDNRRHNLRVATVQQNATNRKFQINNSSGYTGVTFHAGTQKYRAKITVGQKQISLGLYHTAKEAAYARDDAARELHRGFAVLNFPNEHER